MKLQSFLRKYLETNIEKYLEYNLDNNLKNNFEQNLGKIVIKWFTKSFLSVCWSLKLQKLIMSA